MSGYAGSGSGGGDDGRFGSLTPSRRAPPIPASNGPSSNNSQTSFPSNAQGGGSSYQSKSQESFVPPLASYASSSSSNPSMAPSMTRMNSNGSMPIGQGGGAGGGSYTGPLRPVGPGAVSNSSATPWSSGGSGGANNGGGGIIRKGYVSVKEDGIRSWIWSKRWLALREQTLTFHKNEVSEAMVTI
jgi:hypothetical protein